jgi:prepilin-type N-terminal cleavage/methylation domain-containing protein
MAINMKINQKGFTLIEILVVIAIIGVVMGITSDVFIQIIKASNKANIVTEVKQNGDSVLNQLDRIIRNAEEVSAWGYKSSGTWQWEDKSLFDSVEKCPVTSPTPICAIIVKNPVTTGGYTKIEIHPEYDTECTNSPFTTSDQFIISGATKCNGNIRLVTDTTTAALTNLKASTPIGQVITNTEVRSGVSVIPTVISGTTVEFFAIRSVPDKPTVITISFTLQQGIAASSRLDSLAKVPFATTLSLRSY